MIVLVGLALSWGDCRKVGEDKNEIVSNIETNASVYEGSIIKCIVHYHIIGNRAIEEKKIIEGVNLI
jgi:hypothetical protein